MTRTSIAGVLCALLLVAGCTSHPESEPPRAPVPPPTVLGTLDAVAAGDDTGANDWVDDLAARGAQVVGVGRVLSFRSMPTFRLSADGGRTWREAGLDDPSLRATPLASAEYPSAVVPAIGEAGWVALGFEERAVAWTSPDGLVWTRHELPSTTAVAATDEVSDLAATGSGYVAVGSRTAGAGTTPMSWTSTDGVGWTAHVLPGSGSGAAVAARGTTVVAVGSTGGGQDDARAWRSVDGGRSWTSVSVPRPPKDGDFERSLRSVTVTGSGFTALGSAWTDDWEPTLYRSEDGRAWRYDSGATSIEPGTAAEGTDLAPADDAVLASQTISTFDHARFWYASGRRWTAARTPLDGLGQTTSNWYVYSLVRSVSGWVTTVVQESNGRLRGHLWFSRDGHSFEAVEEQPSRWDVPSTGATDLAVRGDQPVAVGRSRGLPVVWPLGGDPLAPTPPVLLENSPRYSVDGASAAGAQLVAWGSELGGNQRYATTWTSSDGRTFQRSRAGAFGTADTYGYSEIAAVRRVGTTWIAVGEQSTNGSAARSALVATSVDGVRWTAGRPALDYTPVRGKIRRDITDLAGADDHLRSVNDVVQAGSLVLALGWAGRSGAEQPSTWFRVVDARGRERWFRRDVPLHGYEAGTMHSVQAKGAHLVVLGSVRRRDSATWHPYVWTSDDSGNRWRGALLPLGGVDPARLDMVGLVRTTGAYVIVGDANGDVSRPVAWWSSDGRSWAPLALTDLPPDGQDAYLSGISARGDRLVGLVRHRTGDGSGTTLFSQVVG